MHSQRLGFLPNPCCRHLQTGQLAREDHMTRNVSTCRSKVKEALKILGIRNFLLGIHDAAFPSLPAEDIGCGSPYSIGAAQFLEFAAELGFDGIQFGPQGITTPGNRSPYDGSFFSRNPLSLALFALAGPGWNLFEAESLASLVDPKRHDNRPADSDFPDQSSQRIAAAACSRFRQMVLDKEPAASLSIRSSYVRFRRRNAEWLERDALYEVLRQIYGGNSWQHWGGHPQAALDRQLFSPATGYETKVADRILSLRGRFGKTLEDYYIIQFLLAEQHRQLKRHGRRFDLKLFGDCQIGFSERDAWAARSFLLPGYLMGAPPSRTNPAGQPWNYPLLDPRQYYLDDREASRQAGPAVRFFRSRIDKLFDEFDGLRIDHPHGLICPWVYRAGQEDPVRAVQAGARLFASPNLTDHPDLARFAIARAEQINQQVARFDDDWVTGLDPGQVRRYGLLFDELMQAARENGRESRQIACEILSTQPYPIKRVMESYGLGRFRVTQKADLDQPLDVYRSENACPEDWLMLGNHDTPTIWEVAKGWSARGTSTRQAAYLASRLNIPDAEQGEWLENASADPNVLVQAKFADLFIGPARNVVVYFTDLFGLLQGYNQPGTISAENWTLRVDPDYRSKYSAGLAQNLVLNIPGALARALRSKGSDCVSNNRDLIADLESVTPSG